MNSVNKKILGKICLMLIFAVILTVAMLGSTFAAMSAKFVWSDDTQTGEFDFTDTEMTFDLFGGKDILPGDSGSTMLDVPEFKDNLVAWSFSEANDRQVPVVYYTEDADNKITAYSAYPFAENHSLLQIKIGDSFIRCADITRDPVIMAEAIAKNKSISWIWPNTLFDADGADASAELSDYIEYNNNLCRPQYAFKDISALKQHISRFAVKGNADLYDTVYTFSFINELPVYGENNTPVPLCGNIGFDGSTAVGKDSAYIVFIDGTDEGINNFETVASREGIGYEKINKYSKADTNDNQFRPDESGRYMMYKILPSAVSTPAKITVTITATVTSV